MWSGGSQAVEGGSQAMEGGSQAVEGSLSELAAPKVRTFPFLVEAHFKHKP